MGERISGGYFTSSCEAMFVYLACHLKVYMVKNEGQHILLDSLHNYVYSSHC